MRRLPKNQLTFGCFFATLMSKSESLHQSLKTSNAELRSVSLLLSNETMTEFSTNAIRCLFSYNYYGAHLCTLAARIAGAVG